MINVATLYSSEVDNSKQDQTTERPPVAANINTHVYIINLNQLYWFAKRHCPEST